MRIRSRLERLEEELLAPPAGPSWIGHIRIVDSRRGECYGFDPEKGDPNWVEPEPLIFQCDPHREPGWRMADATHEHEECGEPTRKAAGILPSGL